MLSIPLETLGWIIVEARAYDAGEANPANAAEDDDDSKLTPLIESHDDATPLELTSWIDDLTRRQQAELVALFWLGRDGWDLSEYPRLLGEATERQDTGAPAQYLLGSPLLGDHLEAGLEALGMDP
ncbi:MAG: DUF3775 domain-containing protein, partial [Pseudomonadota bacterium]